MPKKYLHDLFINEAMPALDRHSGGVGGSDDTSAYILATVNGVEIPAIMVSEETVFDATANDIRKGKVAATEDGVTTGTKVIPSYHTSEAVRYIPSGSEFTIPLPDLDRYDFTELQAIICPYNGTIAESVKAEKVVIERNVYSVLSVDPLTAVTSDSETKSIDLGIVNDTDIPYIIRYFTYKEIL